MDKDLEILLKCCTIFGIYIPESRYASRKLQTLLTLYIILLMTILSINCILGILFSCMDNDFIISWFVCCLIFISQLFVHLIMMWECLAKQREHSDFLRLLHEIKVSFKLRLMVEVRRPAIMVRLRRTFVISSLISIMGLLLYSLNLFILNEPGFFRWALFSIVAMRLRILQFQMYIEFLANYLVNLNQKLHQVVILKTEYNKLFLDIDYKNLESMEYLKHIKELYTCIDKAFHCLNECSQASLFATTASYFLDCTCHIYWTLLALDKLLPTAAIIAAMVTIIPLGLNIFNICYMCQLVKQECHRTSLMVTRLMVTNSAFTCLESKKTYRSLVYDFSLQLFRRRVDVTDRRFFNFDLKFIFGICALIVTHLIILLQFSKSEGYKVTYSRTRNEV